MLCDQEVWRRTGHASQTLVVYPPTGSTATEREMHEHPAYVPYWSMVHFTFTLMCSVFISFQTDSNSECLALAERTLCRSYQSFGVASYMGHVPFPTFNCLIIVLVT